MEVHSLTNCSNESLTEKSLQLWTRSPIIKFTILSATTVLIFYLFTLVCNSSDYYLENWTVQTALRLKNLEWSQISVAFIDFDLLRKSRRSPSSWNSIQPNTWTDKCQKYYSRFNFFLILIFFLPQELPL